jgi:ABC-type branched-subunit amino acid transport system permease subunit
MRFLIGLIALVTVRRERRTNNENGIATTLLEGNVRQLAMLIAVVLLTVVTAVVIRSRLGRQYGGRARRALTDRSGQPYSLNTSENCWTQNT